MNRDDFRVDGVRRLFRLRGRSAIERDIDDEIRFHIDTRTDALMRSGASAVDARATAEREFGSLALAHDQLISLDRRIESRERHLDWREALTQDLRDALRSLRRSPGFVAAVIGTIAVGVGANASMFGIVDRVLFQPPPLVQNADRIGRVYFTRTFPWSGIVTQNAAGYEQYDALRGATTVDAVAAFFGGDGSVGRGIGARKVRENGVTASFFPLLGVRPQLGRFFSAQDDEPPRGIDVVVVSDRFWRRELGRAPDAIGRPLIVGGRPFRIIGVAPVGFTGVDLDRVDLWVPLTVYGHDGLGDDWRKPGVSTWLTVLVRRKPNVPPARVDAELTVLFKRVRDELDRKYAGKIDPTVRAAVGPISAARALAGASDHDNDVRNGRIARWLFGMSMFVLLIACANVANLALARAIRRRREIAVRIALGISRGRLLRQLTTEGFLLAASGAVGGLLLAATGGSLLRRLLVPDVDWESQPVVDARLFIFLGVVIAVITLLTAVYPARQVSRPSTLDELRQGARGGGLQRSSLRSGLLVTQAALAAMLLVGSGLFVKSLRNVLGVPLGFDAAHSWVVEYQTDGFGISSSRRIQLYEQARDAAARVPGVASASLALTAPFLSSYSGGKIRVPGIDSIPTPTDGGPYVNAVSPEFFATMHTRILRGRGFATTDGLAAPRVIVIGEVMARQVWKGANPIGQCAHVGRDTMPCSTIVGIVENMRRYALDDASYQFYVPLAQQQVGAKIRTLLVRIPGDPARVIGPLRNALATIEPGLPFVEIRQLESLVDPLRQSWRLGAIVFSIFGAIATAIAALGLYAMIAYEVARRRREFGIRLALGAARQHVVRIVLTEGVGLVAVGLLVGCAAALAIGPQLQSLLYRESARDPMVFASVSIGLLITAVAACVLPSVRAARIDPARTLQAE